MQDRDRPNETPAEAAETASTEKVTGARRVGLWKILAVSLAIVLVGFAIVAGIQPG